MVRVWSLCGRVLGRAGRVGEGEQRTQAQVPTLVCVRSSDATLGVTYAAGVSAAPGLQTVSRATSVSGAWSQPLEQKGDGNTIVSQADSRRNLAWACLLPWAPSCSQEP